MSAVLIPGYVTAQLRYDRREPQSRFHSESDRQERINKLADITSEQITADVMRFDSEAMEIAGLLFSEWIEPEDGASLLRLFLAEDPTAHHLAIQRIRIEFEKAVQRTAGLRAIRAVEDGEE